MTKAEMKQEVALGKLDIKAMVRSLNTEIRDYNKMVRDFNRQANKKSGKLGGTHDRYRELTIALGPGDGISVQEF